jgi:hypothetical protein
VNPAGVDRAAPATIVGLAHANQQTACDTVAMREAATLELALPDHKLASLLDALEVPVPSELRT